MPQVKIVTCGGINPEVKQTLLNRASLGQITNITFNGCVDEKINLIIIAFLELQAGAGVGDNWGPALEKVANETAIIRSTINDKYNVLVDAGPYAVYFKP